MVKVADKNQLKVGQQDQDLLSSTASEFSEFDLESPEIYLNRELGWLQFNRRVLCQARDERIPLLERLKFLAISGSNLDEFFMKRVGGLKQQVAAYVQEKTADGRTPQQQIEEIYAEIAAYQVEKCKIVDQVILALKAEGVEILSYESLNQAERQLVYASYYDNIFPLVTPQSVDPAHPFPFISNLSLNLLVTLCYSRETETSLARVKVPISAGAPRFLPVGEGNRFVLLEEVMEKHLDLLFPGMKILNCELFRVTRNANTSATEEHADDLIEVIESALQDRKFAPIVRLQIRSDMEPVHRGRLASELGLDADNDVFEVKGMIGLRDLWELVNLNLPDLKLPLHQPVDHPSLQNERNIFHTIREARSILLQHPYESFSSTVERFLLQAATDPKVRGIKMTLYRTDPGSRIIDYLIRAAQNGKQVAVVVELKASFDEQANIGLASRMEEAGVHVTYGVVGLKTHAKMILVIRQDFKGLRRYVHIGTGNYHPGTARVYSDLGLLLYDKDIGRDATELFNYLTTGFTPRRKYNKLLPAPKILKPALLDKIEREINQHSEKSPGLIRFKMNALEDIDLCKAIYRASRAGVTVDLIVRDSCRIRPQVPGLSENIRVISIVDRFLEHARIYYFHNAGDEEVFIGSADIMTRNLEKRVEVLVPVDTKANREQLCDIFETQWQDNKSAWDMLPDGSYVQRNPKSAKSRGCQQILIARADKRSREMTRQKKDKTKAQQRRNTRA